MSDLLLQPVNDGYEWDFVFDGMDLEGDETIQSAVIYSLLTDREDPTLSTGQRGGSWMDFLLDDPTDREGSLLWTLRREKQTDQTLALAVDYAEQALQWMIDDSVASSVTVTGQWLADGWLGLQISIAPPVNATAEQLALFQQNTKPVSMELSIKLLFSDSLVIPVGV